jgi:hypothetical protein
LSQAIWEIRRTLYPGDGGAELIETLRGRGYRFVGTVERRQIPSCVSPIDMQRVRLLAVQRSGCLPPEPNVQRVRTIEPAHLLTALELLWGVAADLAVGRELASHHAHAGDLDSVASRRALPSS